MRTSPHAKGDANALRRQLLIELSVLRRRYAQLADGEDGAEQDVHADHHDDTAFSSPSASAGSMRSAIGTGEDADDAGALCQSDRDAIEALFHSLDDFTRDFNEGKGGLERGDIVSKIMRGNMSL